MSDRRLGVTFPLPDWRLRDHRGWVERLPDLGFTDLWTGEANLTDAFVALASAAQWAPTLRLGTGIVPAFTRSPGLLAMSAASMADVTSGQFVLGVGASSPAVVEHWGGTPWEQPFARTRDVARFLRQAMTGERVSATYETFSVDGFRLTPKPETPPAVLVAGLRPGMLRMAGREADGAVLTWASPQDIRRMVPYVHEGGPDKEIVAWVTVYPTTDAEAVRHHMRPLITGYFTVGAYAEFHRWAGRGPQLEPMWDAWERGDRRGALAAVPDTVIDELVIHGPPEHCREQLEAYFEAGVDTLTLSVMAVDGDMAGAVAAVAPR